MNKHSYRLFTIFLTILGASCAASEWDLRAFWKEEFAENIISSDWGFWQHGMQLRASYIDTDSNSQALRTMVTINIKPGAVPGRMLQLTTRRDYFSSFLYLVSEKTDSGFESLGWPLSLINAYHKTIPLPVESDDEITDSVGMLFDLRCIDPGTYRCAVVLHFKDPESDTFMIEVWSPEFTIQKGYRDFAYEVIDPFNEDIEALALQGRIVALNLPSRYKMDQDGKLTYDSTEMEKIFIKKGEGRYLSYSTFYNGRTQSEGSGLPKRGFLRTTPGRLESVNGRAMITYRIVIYDDLVPIGHMAMRSGAARIIFEKCYRIIVDQADRGAVR